MNYVVVDLEWNQAMSSKSSVFNKQIGRAHV